MGNWTVLSATPSIKPRNDVFGNFFALTFRLKYTPTRFGSFKEMPTLEWKETILMIERNNGTYWQITVDQYKRDPNSQTFISWVSRYDNAHYNVRRQTYSYEGVTKIYDNNGQRIPQDTFPIIEDTKEQAEFVRKYLKNNGGIMEVSVVDKPGINKPNNDRNVLKERFLTFDCGLQGAGPRTKAYQHLVVSGALPENRWTRDCVLSSITPPYSTAGLRQVPPPADVSVVKPFTGASGGRYL